MADQGELHERRACRFLTDEGMTLVARNFRARTGEIDIIALHDGVLVFVEVRARSNPRYAGAAASVDLRKRRRLLRTAQYFLQRNPGLGNLPCRFDVVAFEPPQSGTGPGMRWIKNAFTA